jgi:tRNA (mo5U34)-methyltransferase
MDTQTLTRRVEEIPFWYHRIDLGNGIVTPGAQPVQAAAYRLPDSLEGKRVLDVGAADGYWTFEALKRGAKEVVAIDDFSDTFGLPEEMRRTGDNGWAAFDLAREALGYGEDRCSRREMSIYEVAEESLGRFDLVLCYGVLEYLRHPLLGIDLLSSVCDGELRVELAINDDFSPYLGGFGRGYPGNHVVMEFYPTNQYAGNPMVRWAPSMKCMLGMLYSAGFRENGAWKLVESGAPNSVDLCRGFAVGRKVRAGETVPARSSASSGAGASAGGMYI